MIILARPIAPTPTLYGKDADEFVRKMFEPPTKRQKEFAKKLHEKFKDHDPFVD